MDQARTLMNSLGPDYVGSTLDVEQALDDPSPWGAFQILHISEMFKFDVFVPREDDFVRSMFDRLQSVTAAGAHLRVLSAEDILVMKLRWYELGNRVSDRQWNDIVQVIEVQAEHLDRQYVRHWARHFGLEELAEEAFSEALPVDL